MMNAAEAKERSQAVRDSRYDGVYAKLRSEVFAAVERMVEAGCSWVDVEFHRDGTVYENASDAVLQELAALGFGTNANLSLPSGCDTAYFRISWK